MIPVMYCWWAADAHNWCKMEDGHTNHVYSRSFKEFCRPVAKSKGLWILPRAAMIAANMTMPTGWTRSFPIGYLYLFSCCIVHLVKRRITPARRSSRDSKVEATIASDLLFTDANICTQLPVAKNLQSIESLQPGLDLNKYLVTDKPI